MMCSRLFISLHRRSSYSRIRLNRTWSAQHVQSSFPSFPFVLLSARAYLLFDSYSNTDRPSVLSINVF